MKHAWTVLLCALIIFSLTACSDTLGSLAGDLAGSGDDLSEYEAGAIKLESAATYRNEYLGVTFSLPAGWYIYDIAEDNFAVPEGLTSDSGSLDIYRGGDYRFMFLIDCANLQNSAKSNHMGFTLFADQVDGFHSLADYMDYYDADQVDYYGYTLLETDSVKIGDQFAEVRVYEEFDPDNADYHLYRMSFVLEATDGYYLVAESSYWPENTDAPAYLTNFLIDNLAVAAPARPVV